MNRLVLISLLLSAFFANAAQASEDVLVLPGLQGDREVNRRISLEVADDLVKRGFLVMNALDVQSLFRAAGCYDIDGDKAREMPFALARSLNERGVGLVVHADFSSRDENDGYFSARLIAIDTRRGQVVVRRKARAQNRQAFERQFKKELALLKNDTRGISGQRLISGVSGTAAYDFKNAQGQSMRQLLKSSKPLKLSKCSLESERRFELVLRVQRDSSHRVVVEGDQSILLSHSEDESLALALTNRGR